MSDWLLHHYAASPYAEKARLMLGRKRLAWGSIEVPMVPPRPVLQRLLGGFRRIPVLQRGADLFIDTRLLPDVLDSVHPEPALLPPHARALFGCRHSKCSLERPRHTIAVIRIDDQRVG